MGGMEIFAIIFLVFMTIFIFAGALDMLGEKARKAIWDEVTRKLFKGFEQNKKE